MPLNQSKLRLDQNYFQRVLLAAFTIQQNNVHRDVDPHNSTRKISESNCIGAELTNGWATEQLVNFTDSIEAGAATLTNSELEGQAIVESAKNILHKNLATGLSTSNIEPLEMLSEPDSLRLDDTFDLLNCDEGEDGGDGGELLEFVPESEVEATVKQALLTTRADGAALALRRRGRLV